jgi:hypothetical protein
MGDVEMIKQYDKNGDFTLVEYPASQIADVALAKEKDKDDLITEVSNIRDRKITSLLVEYPSGSGVHYQADPISQRDLKFAIAEIERGNLPWEAPNNTWWDVDNVQHIHTITTLGELSAAMTMAYSVEKRKARSVKDSCKGKSLEEIQAIVEQYKDS